MNISIPDDLSPQQRRKLLTLAPIKYALEIKGNKTAAAEFLDLSVKTVFKAVLNNPEFFGNILTKRTTMNIDFTRRVQEMGTHREMDFWAYFNERYASKPGFIYSTEAGRNRIRNIALANYQKEYTDGVFFIEL